MASEKQHVTITLTKVTRIDVLSHHWSERLQTYYIFKANCRALQTDLISLFKQTFLGN